MKYFTPQIWAGWQGNDAAFDLAVRRWKQNLARYKVNLRKLSARLKPQESTFFAKHELHDGRLLQFSICDWPPSNLKRKHAISETAVRIIVLAGMHRAMIYRLFYRGVEEISVRTQNNLFPLDHSRFGDWGYDELLAEGRRVFRHNILFQTGTEVSISFQKFRFETQQATARRLRQFVGPFTETSASNRTVRRKDS